MLLDQLDTKCIVNDFAPTVTQEEGFTWHFGRRHREQLVKVKRHCEADATKKFLIVPDAPCHVLEHIEKLQAQKRRFIDDQPRNCPPPRKCPWIQLDVVEQYTRIKCLAPIL